MLMYEDLRMLPWKLNFQANLRKSALSKAF